MRGFNRYSVLSVAITLAMLFSGILAEAHIYHIRDRGSVMRHLLKGLDLSAQQKQEIKGIMQSHSSDLLAEKVAVLHARENLLTVTMSGAFDANAVQAAYRTVAAAQEQMTVQRAEMFNQVMSVLATDQQTVVKGRIAKTGQRLQRSITKLQVKLNPKPQSNS